MVDELADAILIEPDAIPEYLKGEAKVGSGELVVKCDGVDVCKYTDGKLTHVACDHPRHGAHPMYRERYKEINALIAKFKKLGPVNDGPCPKCDGVYWLEIESAAAHQQVIMSMGMGIWKGVPYKTGQLNPKQTSDMIGAFLAAVKAEDASSGPVGMAAPDRANFHHEAAAKAAGTGQGKGEDDE